VEGLHRGVSGGPIAARAGCRAQIEKAASRRWRRKCGGCLLALPGVSGGHHGGGVDLVDHRILALVIARPDFVDRGAGRFAAALQVAHPAGHVVLGALDGFVNRGDRAVRFVLAVFGFRDQHRDSQVGVALYASEERVALVVLFLGVWSWQYEDVKIGILLQGYYI